LAIVAAGAAAWAFVSPGTQLASMLPSNPFTAAKPLQGRGLVVSAEVLKVGGQVIRLTGVEAPDRNQRCGLPGKRTWTCGRSAEYALQRLAGGKELHCDLSGTDDAGRALGVCRHGDVEINAQLVKEGHVFASEGLLARYSSQQDEARRQKVGIWKGDAERPSVYRAKRWDEAKRKSPEGCPIKGRVVSRAKIYVLPWSPDYDGVHIRAGRGERWFCSEQDAVAAGWRAAEKS
jgi:endonuclease YncB( thermonuclease family)